MSEGKGEKRATRKNHPDELNKLLNKHSRLFSSEWNGIRGIKASLKLKPYAKPVFQRTRPVPYAMRSAADKTYDKLMAAYILYPVSYNDWASPVVHVQKENGEIRVCGDYKKVNERIEDEGYKLPTVQDLFVKLSQNGPARFFSKLDLSGAFNQLNLDDNSAKLLVLNTERGLMASRRLIFGVKTAPADLSLKVFLT